MFDIIDRWTSAVLYHSDTANNVMDAFHEARKSGADLSDAVLSGAVLRDADLRGAVLRGADLSDAVLSGAVLRDADLRGAVLRGAVLRGAVLRGAVLSDNTVMPYGETWRVYLNTVVPQLCMAGGKPLTVVACQEHWDCNSWDNCPMAAAFDIHSEKDVPLLLRPRVLEFVQFFDAGLIPMPTQEKPEDGAK